jgi:hypothetical protein
MSSNLTNPAEAPLVKEIRWALDSGRSVVAVNVIPYDAEGGAIAAGMLDAMFALIAGKSEMRFASMEVRRSRTESPSIAEDYMVNQIAAVFGASA